MMHLVVESVAFLSHQGSSKFQSFFPNLLRHGAAAHVKLTRFSGQEKVHNPAEGGKHAFRIFFVSIRTGDQDADAFFKQTTPQISRCLVLKSSKSPC